MKTIAVLVILLCSTAHATDFFLNKGVDGWECKDRNQYYPVSVTNGELGVNVGQGDFNGKCRPQDPFVLNQKYGLSASVSCTSSSFTVKLSEGKAMKNPIDPNDVMEGTYFTIVLDTHSNGGNSVDPKPSAPVKTEPKKEPRIPNKW